MNHEPKERRKSRRVATDLDVKLVGLGAAGTEAQALNVSAGGVYCLTPRYLTPLTKVEMTLVLPAFESRAGAGSEGEEGAAGGEPGHSKSEPKAPIVAEGIVVRCDPYEDGDQAPRMADGIELYSLGIAFLHLTAEDQARIEAYVSWRLERSLIESAEG